MALQMMAMIFGVNGGLGLVAMVVGELVGMISSTNIQLMCPLNGTEIS